jgi:glycine cleavage system regulatory protein
MIQTLNGEMNGLPNKIVVTLKSEQKDLLDRISEKFNQKVTESQSAVEQSMRNELSGLVPLSQQQQILDRFTDMFKYTLMTIGTFQLATVKSESEQVFNDTATKIKTAVVPFTENMSALQEKVNAISKE